eukprot:Sdes_comp20296_c0_seq2m13902
MVNIAIVYYSTYGHVAKLADSILEGCKAAGVTATLYQVAETLPADVLAKMGAPPKAAHPVATPEILAAADGVLFGFPTRFGMAPAQMKAFLDQTGGLWQAGKLIGKPAGIFFSTATLGGGQETSALTFVTQLVHHGMVYVPLGYANPSLMNIAEVHGGSPYGAGTLAGTKGERQPSPLELGLAKSQGENFSKFVSALTKGRAAK